MPTIHSLKRLRRLFSAAALATFVLVSACGGSDSSAPAPAPAPTPVPAAEPARATRITVTPAGLVLRPGEPAQLSATVLDQRGAPMTGVTVVWHTSNSAVTVAADGKLTAGANVDSTQITAEVGSTRSAPIHAMVVQMVTGARLVSDEEVLLEPEPIDNAQSGAPGSRFNARIGGAAPAPGQVLLGSGGKPIAGRVVSTTPAATGHDVVLEIVGLAEVFEQAKIVSVIDASTLPVQFPSGDPISETVLPNGTVDRRFTLTVPATTAPALAASRASALGATEGRERAAVTRNFSVGPLKCKAEGNAAPNFAASSLEVSPVGALGVVESTFIVDGGAAYAKVLAQGYFGVQISGSLRLSGQLDGSVKCKAILVSVPIPVPPQVALIVHPVIPIGLGFSVNGTLNSPGLELKLDSSVSQPITAGFELLSDGTLVNLSVLDRTQLQSSFNWNLRADPAAAGFRFEADASAGLFADVGLTSPFVERAASLFGITPYLGLVEGSAGFKATARLQAVAAQLAAPAQPSQYNLKFVARVGTSDSVNQALALLGSLVSASGFSNPQIVWEPNVLRSPAGAGTATLRKFRVGDQIKFNVFLAPETLKASLLERELLPYNVKRVEVWRKEAGGGAVRVASRDATEGDVEFSMSWAADADGELNNTYYAMVVPVLGDTFSLLLGEMRGWEGIRQVGGNGRDEAYGFGTDDQGRVYIATTTSSQLSYLDPATGALVTLPQYGGWDTQIVRYNPLGAVTGALSFGGPGDDAPIRMRRGPDGALYAVGTTAFGSQTGVDPGSNFSAWIAKIDVSGVQPKLVWRRQIGGRNEFAFGMDIGADGSIYTVSSIAGSQANLAGSTVFVQACGDELAGSGRIDDSNDCGDMVVTRLSADGDVIWRSIANRPGWQLNPSIAVRGTTIYLTSGSYCEIEDASVNDVSRGPCVANRWLDPATNTLTNLSMIGVSRIDTSGGAFTHLKSIRLLGGGTPATASMAAFALAINDSGRPMIGGNRIRTGPGFGTSAIPSEYFLAALDDFGEAQWVKFFPGNAQPAASGLARASDGDYYATFASSGSLYAPNAGGRDAVVVKIGQDGTERWGVQYGSPGNERPHGVDLDASGNVFVYGNTTGGWGAGLSAGFGERDLFVLKLSARGQIQSAPRSGARSAQSNRSALPLAR